MAFYNIPDMPNKGFGYDPMGYNSGSLYVNPYRQGDQSAKDMMADLYEAEFQDYLTRFFPVEKDLIAQMTTGFEDLQQEEIGRAQAAVARQYANVRGQEQRRQAGYGLQLRPETQGDYQRSPIRRGCAVPMPSNRNTSGSALSRPNASSSTGPSRKLSRPGT